MTNDPFGFEESEGSVCLNCDKEMKSILSLGPCPHCGGGVVLKEDVDD